MDEFTILPVETQPTSNTDTIELTDNTHPDSGIVAEIITYHKPVEL